MADEITPNEDFLEEHLAFRMKDNIVLVSSDDKMIRALRLLCDGKKVEKMVQRIWVYNLWTEQWNGYKMPEGKKHPSARGQCCVAIEPHAYFFGGMCINNPTYEDTLLPFDKPNYTHLWKLTLSNDSFEWTAIEIENHTKKPLPRTDHCGWEYGQCMWIFGGCIALGLVRYIDLQQSQPNYLNQHGDITVYGDNNQLLCFDPSTKGWQNVKSSGAVPSPRCYA